MKYVHIIIMVALTCSAALAETITYTRAAPSGSLAVTWVSEVAFHLEGEALWSGPNEGQIHFGHISGIAHLASPGNTATFEDGDSDCALHLTMEADRMIVKETSPAGSCGGLHVTFNGVYTMTAIDPPPEAFEALEEGDEEGERAEAAESA